MRAARDMSMNFFFAKSLGDKNAAQPKAPAPRFEEKHSRAGSSQAQSTPSSQSWGTQEPVRTLTIDAPHFHRARIGAVTLARLRSRPERRSSISKSRSSRQRNRSGRSLPVAQAI